jgi:hypothetical protein
MAKTQRAATDVSAEFINALNDLQKVSNKANFTIVPTRGATAIKGSDVCNVYVKVKPFLEIIVRIPFIPAKAKQGIMLLMSALDGMCPTK